MSLLGCGPSPLNLLGLQHVHFMFFEDHNPHACKAKHILTKIVYVLMRECMYIVLLGIGIR